MERTEASVKVYRSVKELPKVLEPGRYVVEGIEVEIHEPCREGGAGLSAPEDAGARGEVWV